MSSNTNIRQAMYQCLETTLDDAATNKTNILLCSADKTKPYALTLYMSFKYPGTSYGYSYLKLELAISRDTAPYFDISQAFLDVPSNFRLELFGDTSVTGVISYYFSQKNIDNTNDEPTASERITDVTIRKEIKYGYFPTLLSSYVESLNSYTNIVNIGTFSHDTTGISSGQFTTDAASNALVATLNSIPGTGGAIGNINAFKEGHFTQIFANSINPNPQSTESINIAGNEVFSQLKSITWDTSNSNSNSGHTVINTNNGNINLGTGTLFSSGNIGSNDTPIGNIYANNLYVDDITHTGNIIITDTNGTITWSNNNNNNVYINNGGGFFPQLGISEITTDSIDIPDNMSITTANILQSYDAYIMNSNVSTLTNRVANGNLTTESYNIGNYYKVTNTRNNTSGELGYVEPYPIITGVGYQNNFNNSASHSLKFITNDKENKKFFLEFSVNRTLSEGTPTETNSFSEGTTSWTKDDTESITSSLKVGNDISTESVNIFNTIKKIIKTSIFASNSGSFSSSVTLSSRTSEYGIDLGTNGKILKDNKEINYYWKRGTKKTSNNVTANEHEFIEIVSNVDANITLAELSAELIDTADPVQEYRFYVTNTSSSSINIALSPNNVHFLLSTNSTTSNVTSLPAGSTVYIEVFGKFAKVVGYY